MTQYCKIELSTSAVPAVEQDILVIDSADLFGRWNESRLLDWVTAQLLARDGVRREQMDEARIAA